MMPEDASLRERLAGEPVIAPLTLYTMLGGDPSVFDEEAERLCIEELERFGYERQLVVAGPFSAPKHLWVREEDWPEDEKWKEREAQLQAACDERIASYLDIMGIVDR